MKDSPDQGPPEGFMPLSKLAEIGVQAQLEALPSCEKLEAILLRNGWSFSDTKDDILPNFNRQYSRVNTLLEGDVWKATVLDFCGHLEKTAPYLPRGLNLFTSGDETEVTIGIAVDKESKTDLAKAVLLDAWLRQQDFEVVEDEVLHGWLQLKGEPGAPVLSGREFYEQDPRSAALREICLELIANYKATLLTEGSESDTTSRIIELSSQLTQLGIAPNMHAGLKRAGDFANPVIRAERIAGALKEALEQGYGLSGNAAAIIAQHSVEDIGHISMLDPTTASPAACEYLLFLRGLKGLAKQLGIEAEE